MPHAHSTSGLSRRHFLQASAIGLPLALACTAAHATNLPETIRIVCGFAPGGTADAISRWVAEKLTGQMAKTVLVDNRPGAGGRIAVEHVKQSNDPNVLLLTPSSVLAMYPHVYQKLNYDPLQDLAPVSQVCDFVHGLAVGPAVPASVKTLGDFIAWCKQNPDKASCGNTGDGSMPHFLTIMLSQAMGVKIEPIPYRGTAPGLNDLLAGQLTALMGPDGSFVPYKAEGKVRVIATSGRERSSFFPDTPTFAEQGAASMVVGEWFGLFKSAKTDNALVARIAEAVHAGVQGPEMAERFARIGMVAVGSTPQALGERLNQEHAFWGPIVKASGFTPLSA